MESIIHDIKTERQNVSEGLPGALKLVPVLFYLATVASLLLTVFFYLSQKAYEKRESEMTVRLSEAEVLQNGYLAEQESIVAESKQAEGYAEWLEGSHPLQPVVVSIGRSMGKDSTIAELALDRNPEIPAHTFMQLKIDGGGSQQIETTLNDIYALNYLTYSAQQVKGRNSTDFQATLIYNTKK
ncbi:MAG: hypothetical protein MI807_14885 [Verrucomicrobiales bacterium]|nr:hypothetical protein [Verrucomicrobiales bacterium]